MKSSLEHLFAAGTGICVLALSLEAMAAAIQPRKIIVDEDLPEVVAALCNFPRVVQKKNVAITSPVEVKVEEQEMRKDGTPTDYPTAGAEAGVFRVRLTISESSFSFEDVSMDKESPNPQYSQFYDVLGTEAVVAESGDSANVYCNVNSRMDSDLQAPSSPLTRVRIFWVPGPSSLDNQADLDLICNTLQTDFFIGHQITQGPPVDFNGCNGQVPRFCNAEDSRGADFTVPCSFNGFELVTDSIILGSCGGTSGGSKIRC